MPSGQGEREASVVSYRRRLHGGHNLLSLCEEANPVIVSLKIQLSSGRIEFRATQTLLLSCKPLA